MFWVHIIALFVLVIVSGVMGFKLIDGNYDILLEAYLALACIIAAFVSSVYKLLRSRCPHCGRVRLSEGKYCSYCGKEITK